MPEGDLPLGQYLVQKCWLRGLVEGAGSSYDWCEFAGSFFGVALSVGGFDVVDGVCAAVFEGFDVVDDECHWVEVVQVVVDCFAAYVTVGFVPFDAVAHALGVGAVALGCDCSAHGSPQLLRLNALRSASSQSLPS